MVFAGFESSQSDSKTCRFFHSDTLSCLESVKEEEHTWAMPESFLTSNPPDLMLTNKCWHKSWVTVSQQFLPLAFTRPVLMAPKGLINAIYANKLDTGYRRAKGWMEIVSQARKLMFQTIFSWYMVIFSLGIFPPPFFKFRFIFSEIQYICIWLIHT